RYFGSWIERPPQGWQMRKDLEMCLSLPPNNQMVHVSDNSVFFYIQMQHYNGSLKNWISENQRPRDLVRMRTWFKQIVEAVEYMHDNGLIHRNLKPSNILFD
ncbi:hypothetical protein PFISCL1PPCAC_1111, partial [Pristionchus fissidentatus]